MSGIGYQAKPLSRANIRDFAMRVRGALGLADRPYVNVELLIDFLMPKCFPGFSYDVWATAEMGNNHGLARPDERFIILREDVYERACAGKGRDRLTVVHEVAHLLLHTKDRILLRRGTGEPKRFCDPEWQANCFAGEFLVAHTMARQCGNPLEIERMFGVSPDAADFQWKRFKEDGLL